MEKKQICFAVIVGTRGFFNPELAMSGRKDLLSLLEEKGYDYVILDTDKTATGVIEGYDDAKACAELFKAERERIDGVIVSLPNFGDEIGIINTLQMAKLDVPVLVQATNDENDKVNVYQRRDAFCGKISVCNNLYQYGIPFTNTTHHTCDVLSEEFEKDLARFAAVCRVVSGVKKARIGAVGARPAAFQTVRFSEKLLQKAGVTVVPVDLSEIIVAANSHTDEEGSVTGKVKDIKAYGNVESHVKSANVSKQARLSLAIEQFVEDNELDATAVQCWDSIEKNYGCATCLTMSMMGEKGYPSACEMDVAGALSMYILRLAAEEAPGFLDWNNNFDYEKDLCVCTHCSNYPKSFMGSDLTLGELDVLGTTLGKEQCFGAVKGKVSAGDMTYFRVSTDDSKGIIKAYGGHGAFVEDPYDMDGGIAVCHVPNLDNVMNHICSEGFEHHVSMVRGDVSEIIKEALTKYLKWEYTDL